MPRNPGFIPQPDNREPCQGFDKASDSWPVHNPFIDLDSSQWYATAAQWTYENGIISGYNQDGGKAFAPTNTIARAETVTMLYRYYSK